MLPILLFRQVAGGFFTLFPAGFVSSQAAKLFEDSAELMGRQNFRV